MAQRIYDELIAVIREYDAAYNTDTTDGEKPQEHLKRITRYIARDLPEKGWDSFSKEAQDWHDKAADAVRGGTDVPEPDGYPDKPAETRRRRALDDDPPADTSRRRRAAIDDDGPGEEVKKEPTVWNLIRESILKHDSKHPVDRAPKESPDDHLIRTIRYLGRTMPEKDFDALPKSVQEYYEEQAALREKNKSASFSFPQGYPSGASDAAPAASGGKDDDKPGETSGRRGRAPAEDGGANLTDRVMEFVIAHHDMSIDDIKKAMAKSDSGVSDVKESTRAIAAANTVKIIGKVKAAGHWK